MEFPEFLQSRLQPACIETKVQENQKPLQTTRDVHGKKLVHLGNANLVSNSQAALTLQGEGGLCKDILSWQVLHKSLNHKP